MALIKYGPAIADARGSVGGTVFTRGPFGPVMKQRTTPTNPNTDKQAAARALLTTQVGVWQNTLTDAQRQQWNASVQTFTVPGALGDDIHLTGLQFFVKCNCLLDIAGEDPVVVPPVIPIIPAPTFTLAHTVGVAIECTAIGPYDTGDPDKIIYSWGPALQQTIFYNKGPYQYVSVQTAAHFDALPALLVPVGALVASTRLFFRFRAVKDDGASSFPVIYSVDVGDPA